MCSLSLLVEPAGVSASHQECRQCLGICYLGLSECRQRSSPLPAALLAESADTVHSGRRCLCLHSHLPADVQGIPGTRPVPQCHVSLLRHPLSPTGTSLRNTSRLAAPFCLPSFITVCHFTNCFGLKGFLITTIFLDHLFGKELSGIWYTSCPNAMMSFSVLLQPSQNYGFMVNPASQQSLVDSSYGSFRSHSVSQHHSVSQPLQPSPALSTQQTNMAPMGLQQTALHQPPYLQVSLSSHSLSVYFSQSIQLNLRSPCLYIRSISRFQHLFSFLKFSRIVAQQTQRNSLIFIWQTQKFFRVSEECKTVSCGL